MRCRTTSLYFAAALAAAAFAPALGYAQAPPLEIVFSTKADQAALKSDKGALGSGDDIDLLPNANLAYYSYIYNGDTKAHDDFTVVLSTAGLPKTVIATAVVKSVAKTEIQLLVFKPNPKAGAAIAAPVPPAKTVDGTPIPPKENPGLKLPQKMLLEVVETKDPKVPYLEFKPKPITVTLDPSIFLTAVSDYKTAEKDRTLTVTLTPNAKKLPDDIDDLRVKLDIRKDLIPSLDTTVPSDGNYEAAFAPNAKQVILSAKNLKFGDDEKEDKWVAVSVNGFERAFLFKISKIGSSPSPSSAAFLRLSLSSPSGYAVPGNPLQARLELYNTLESKMPQLTFDRGTGVDEVVTRRTFDKAGINSRDAKLYARFEDTGKIVSSSTVQDWSVDLNTKGVYGVGKFTLTAVDAVKKDGKEVEMKRDASVIFDDRAPVVAADGFRAIYPAPKVKGKVDPKAPSDNIFTLPPSRDGKPAPVRVEILKTKEGKLRLVAQASVNLAPIDGDSVLFFIGDPPAKDGKPAVGSIVERGTKWELPKWLIDPKAKVLLTGDWYTAQFDTDELKGKIKVGVRFANKAGLTTEETREILLREPVPPRTVGDVKVTVTQGYDPERPQSKLAVSLLADGKPVSAGKTSDKGEYTFKDLKPGAYTVYSVNPADGNARAFAVVTVIADEEVAVSLSLKR